MSGLDFLDTNVLVYAYDLSDPRKQQIARDLLRQALRGQSVLSAQVLSEFAATLLHKLRPPAERAAIETLLDALGPIRLVLTDGDTVRRAVEVHHRYGVHFYDGMIVAAAEKAGCKRIWSEDLNPGQQYFGITVENPFS